MDKATLQERGGFVSAQPIKREVTWSHVTPQGEKVDDKFHIHVISRSAGVMNQIRRASKEGKDEMALTISAFVRLGEAGDESISYEEALQLDDGLQIVLVNAVSRHWAGRADPKNSRPPMSSGTTSPDTSAASPSQS